MMISQDIQHRNLILIRFNPDGYEKNGIKKVSCWNKNKDGLCSLKKTYMKEWNERLKELEKIDTKPIIDTTINIQKYELSSKLTKFYELVELFEKLNTNI